MTDFADRFRVRYSTLATVWKALAEGETPERFPVEWKSINYYAHVLSNDDDPTVKTAAQAFLREVEVARLDPRTYATRLMLATQSFAQAVCDQAGIAWKNDRRPATRKAPARRAPKPDARTKSKPQERPKTKGKANAKESKRSTPAKRD